ncbi:hypothetical protein MSG28_004999 [Choristoneura fumiferana]|nr:hypothetical protein MSG28_004999 [Choristoneura fumiferana]
MTKLLKVILRDFSPTHIFSTGALGARVGPGSWKPAVIKPKSLKSLYLSVMGPGNVLRAKWTPYDYYHAADIAKHPGFDMKKKTFIYVAGYLDATTLPLGRTMGEIYKKLGYNVLILDTVEFTARDFPV